MFLLSPVCLAGPARTDGTNQVASAKPAGRQHGDSRGVATSGRSRTSKSSPATGDSAEPSRRNLHANSAAGGFEPQDQAERPRSHPAGDLGGIGEMTPVDLSGSNVDGQDSDRD
ncbi:hypothetical protein GCM10017788_71450 [Amycolatopsis acidiphila]|nr:hypothetical protein GCM10017788_71450 [Amycolatopsis acidiphila]